MKPINSFHKHIGSKTISLNEKAISLIKQSLTERYKAFEDEIPKHPPVIQGHLNDAIKECKTLIEILNL